ncbi:MAG: RDD family protein [Deltaproteobacteria bacterium]|nr:RDD family protein [Deltaproteobacteria bacterium]
MPLDWDDDDEEDLTVLELRKRKKSTVLVHDEITVPFATLPSQGPPPSKQTPVKTQYQPSPPQARAVATVIDGLVIYLIYWFWIFCLSYVFSVSSIRALHANPTARWTHYGLTMLMGLLYYLLMEGGLHTTLGKYLCGLKVMSQTPSPLSWNQLLLRNLLRPLDALLFPFVLYNMESSRYYERWGDRLAKTFVAQSVQTLPALVDLKHCTVTPTFLRAVGHVLDSGLMLLLAYGYYLRLSPNHPLLSYALLVNFPFVYLSYYIALEFFIGTTPGKWILGQKVVSEKGTALNLETSILRNLYRPLDCLLGWIVVPFNKNKQRLGDWLAHTLVIGARREKKAGLVCLAACFMILLIFTLGILYPSNHPKPRTITPPLQRSNLKNPTATKTQLPPTTHQSLKFSDFYFASGPGVEAIHADGKFRSGDLIYAFFKVEGFNHVEGQNVQLREHLMVYDPSGKLMISSPDRVVIDKPVDPNVKFHLFPNKIDLPKTAPKGKYRAVFIIRDLLAKGQLAFEKEFEIY